MSQSIKDTAKAYTPKSVKNISELKSVSVDLVIFEETGNKGTDEEFTYKYVEVNDEKYRMPDSVLRDLKAILDKKPNLKTFAVTKQGEGRNTRYITVPID